jgi:hypothetical protein
VLQVRISAEAMENLRKNPRAYVEAEIEERGVAVHGHAAVKIKGSAGSFQGIDARPGFSVHMGKYKGARPFHGVERFQLNNCVQDGSALRELIAGEVARKAGVPASRCTHAIVYLNEKPLGLYVLKEAFREDFLSAFFKRTDGRLYDGGFTADIRKEMELDRGDPADQTRLSELLEALKEPDAQKQFQRLQAVVDVEAYIRYVVLENVLTHWDGYSFNRNNYRMYEDPETRRFHFFLHGMDQTWGDANWSLTRAPGGAVGAALWKEERVRARYLAVLKDVYEKVLRPVNWAARVEEVGKRVQSAWKAVDPQSAEAYAGRAADAKRVVQARLDGCTRQMIGADQLLEQLSSKEGMALDVFVWTHQGDNAKGEETSIVDRKVFHTQVSGESNASWRCSVTLPPGRYRLEGQISTRGVTPLDTPSGSGAGLRISGGSRAGLHGLSGNQNWTAVAFDFESGGAQHVMVAELRAKAGHMWVDRKSLRIRKLP